MIEPDMMFLTFAANNVCWIGQVVDEHDGGYVTLKDAVIISANPKNGQLMLQDFMFPAENIKVNYVCMIALKDVREPQKKQLCLALQQHHMRSQHGIVIPGNA